MIILPLLNPLSGIFMSNNFMVSLLNKMREAQRSAIEQLDKYKSLSIALGEEIRDRNKAIALVESALNPEKANLTLRDFM